MLSIIVLIVNSIGYNNPNHESLKTLRLKLFLSEKFKGRLVSLVLGLSAMISRRFPLHDELMLNYKQLRVLLGKR